MEIIGTARGFGSGVLRVAPCDAILSGNFSGILFGRSHFSVPLLLFQNDL